MKLQQDCGYRGSIAILQPVASELKTIVYLAIFSHIEIIYLFVRF